MRVTKIEDKLFAKRVAEIYREVVGEAGPDGIDFTDAQSIALDRVSGEVAAGTLTVPESTVRDFLSAELDQAASERGWMLHPAADDE